MKRQQTVREHIPKAALPARTPEQREKQIINYAVDLAEEQLRNGTASPLVITHYLKLATVEYQRKIERLQNENALLQARVREIDEASRRETDYKRVIEAMMNYRIPQENDLV